MLKCQLVDIGALRKETEAKGKIFTLKPGMMFFADWYFDPRKDKPEDMWYFMSCYYKEEYSKERPPLVVVCPDGSHWMVDQRASNGPGWAVTGKAPEITCSPSIVVPGYHGYLQNGRFTADLEGRKYNL